MPPNPFANIMNMANNLAQNPAMVQMYAESVCNSDVRAENLARQMGMDPNAEAQGPNCNMQ